MSESTNETTPLPQFYNSIVPLSKNQHGSLRLSTPFDYSFAKESTAVVLTTAEFLRASFHYPIVFLLQQNKILPVVLLGVKDKQNLFVDEQGGWSADYIPAYVRRYPFIPGRIESSDQFTVCIDDSFTNFNNDAGELLFTAEGGQSPYLKRVVEFMQEYQGHLGLTESFCTRLQELELLDQIQANVVLRNETKIALRGFMVVKKNLLQRIDADTLKDLMGKDYLGLIYAHLFSLQNISMLAERFSDTITDQE